MNVLAAIFGEVRWWLWAGLAGSVLLSAIVRMSP